jgi:pyruvate/2-oxoglutarate dehydrogenase complex dihydrolipoamide dehydrogenase (E3) component
MHLVQRRAHEFGVRGVDPNAVSFDLSAAMARKNGIVHGIIDGIYTAMRRNKNITFLRGRAEFTSPVDIRVDGKPITAEKTILAVGSKQAGTPIPGLDETGFLTNYEALQLEQLPTSMIIIGAGYIGVEFAMMYSRFGTKVTLLSRPARVMPKEEPELSEELGRILTAEGIDLHLGTAATRAGVGDRTRWVDAESPDGARRFEGEVILVAAGRGARVDGLGLEQAGVRLEGYFIQVSDTLQTTSPNIWSLGDANGGYMFTHRATYDGPTAALNAVRGLGKPVDYRVVPRAVFTEPALASVGMTEAEARAAGYEVKTGTALFAHSGRAKAIGQTEGMVKLVADAKTSVLLGGHILGPHADILIHEVAVAMYNRGTAEALAKTIHVHPTLPEIVKSAAKALG